MDDKKVKQDKSCFSQVKELLTELSLPHHNERIRNANRNPRAREANLSGGYRLIQPECIPRAFRNTAGKDFHRFMSVCLGIQQKKTGYRIVLRVGRHGNWPKNIFEPYHLAVGQKECVITARDEQGLRRALCFLEDEMSLKRGPFLSRGSLSRWTTIETRITRSPYAPYRWQSGWELLDEHDYYPDEYLNKLAHCGINGIWVAGLFRNLIASKTLPELGPEKHQLDKLKRIIEKAARYGINVYFFCIEPRALPDNHPVFAVHPEIKGAKMCNVTSSLCTSVPIVRKYIREVTGELFRNSPGLAGIINIFNGERGTTCWLNKEKIRTCPRCRTRPQWEVLAESLNQFQKGMRRASQTGKILAWTYAMDDISAKNKPALYLLRETMKRTHPEIVWLANVEHGGRKDILGRQMQVREYSLSYTGPSDIFKTIVSFGKTRTRKVYGKIQAGTTYELPSVPFLPVPDVIFRKIAALKRLNISGIMASWIIGGQPSLMLKTVGEACFQTSGGKVSSLKRLAGIFWSESQEQAVAKAWGFFAEALRYYPNENAVFYFGPITRAPAYQLHLEHETRHADPYNWGIDRNRTPQPFEDDLSHWLGSFTPDELIGSFRKMATKWEKGTAILGKIIQNNGANRECRKQYAVADAIYIHFASTANIIEFYQLRDSLHDTPMHKSSISLQRMLEIVSDETVLCRRMKKHLDVDKTLGFHSEIYAYCYSKPLIDKKIENLKIVEKTLKQWLKTGIDADTLKSQISGWNRLRSSALTEKPSWKQWLAKGD